MTADEHEVIARWLAGESKPGDFHTVANMLARFSPWEDSEDLRRQAEHDRRDRDTFLQQLVEVRAWLAKVYANGRGRHHPIWRDLDAILARQPDVAPCSEYQNGRREGIAWAVEQVERVVHEYHDKGLTGSLLVALEMMRRGVWP